MSLKTIGLAALSAALAISVAGTADAASMKKRKVYREPTMTGSLFAPPRHVVPNNSGIGRFVISPGDSRARISRAYPNDQNPRSLRETYNLRGRAMNENRN